MGDAELVDVYRARDTLHAHLLRNQLEDEGIPTFIEVSHLQAAVGGLPTGLAIAPRLVVEADLADRARGLLETWEHEPPGTLEDAAGDEALGEDLLAATQSENAAGVAHPQPVPAAASPVPGITTWYGHLVGGLAVVWSITSWAAWFAVPLLFPTREGAVPVLDVAVVNMGLLLGCVWLTLQMLFIPMSLTWRSRLLYAAFPASYVIFLLAG